MNAFRQATVTIDPKHRFLVDIPVFQDRIFLELVKASRRLPVDREALSAAGIDGAVHLKKVAVVQGQEHTPVVGDPHLQPKASHASVFRKIPKRVLSHKV